MPSKAHLKRQVLLESTCFRWIYCALQALESSFGSRTPGPVGQRIPIFRAHDDSKGVEGQPRPIKYSPSMFNEVDPISGEPSLKLCPLP